MNVLKKPEIMVKRRIWLLLILIAVLSLLLLSCHVHPYELGGKEDSDCPLCQILCTGLIYVPLFSFSLFFILLILGYFFSLIKSGAEQYFNCDFRAPPAEFLYNGYLN